MVLNWLKLTINVTFLMLVFVRCGDATEKQETKTKGIFDMYFNETFDHDVSHSYYIIIGKQMCQLCEKGAFLSFTDEQKRITSNNIVLITDFTQNEIDTLLTESFEPKILFDTLSNFSNYTFPRSYVTIYKVENGDIVKHAYFSEKDVLSEFLSSENLLK